MWQCAIFFYPRALLFSPIVGSLLVRSTRRATVILDLCALISCKTPFHNRGSFPDRQWSFLSAREDRIRTREENEYGLAQVEI